MKIFSIAMSLLILSCGPQYVEDPNARVVVTSQYENGPTDIISTSKCRPMVDCTGKTIGQCAIALYEASSSYIREGEELIPKQLYMSAKIEFMQALCRLEEAKIRLQEARLKDYQNYRIVEDYGLENKIDEHIDFCERRIRLLRWK
jgi:hypothetical protein